MCAPSLYQPCSVAGLVLVALSSSGQGEDDEQKKSSVFGALLALGGSVL